MFGIKIEFCESIYGYVIRPTHDLRKPWQVYRGFYGSSSASRLMRPVRGRS